MLEKHDMLLPTIEKPSTSSSPENALHGWSEILYVDAELTTQKHIMLTVRMD